MSAAREDVLGMMLEAGRLIGVAQALIRDGHDYDGIHALAEASRGADDVAAFDPVAAGVIRQAVNAALHAGDESIEGTAVDVEQTPELEA